MRYRKKPIPIEAIEALGKGSDLIQWPDWFGSAVERYREMPSEIEVEGGIYPCKQSIFDATYEPVTEEGGE